MPGLTVACFRWGDWGAGHDYVGRLYRGVARHLSAPFRFVCFTDRPQGLPGGVESLPLPTVGWPRNLTKLWLYAPENGLEGRVLALDLDVVITGSLDDMAAYDGRFCTLEDLWQPGRADGAVTAFEAGTLPDLYRLVTLAPATVKRISKGGSERYWYRAQLPEADFWQRLYPGQIADAKPQGAGPPDGRIIQGLPQSARLAVFHGRPRPHEVARPWLTEHWH